MGEKSKKILTFFKNAEKMVLTSFACLSCRRECPENPYRLCKNCLDKIDFTLDNYCLKCGAKTDGKFDYCGQCYNKDYVFDMARSVFTYDDTTAPIIMRFKYNGYKTYAVPLARLLKDFYEKSDIVANVVTFVPMPPRREKERGYNQALELAREFCKLTNLPLMPLLARVKDNEKQSTLAAKDRAKNIIDSFEVVNKKAVKGRDILLIDDVFTTGATSNECSKMLRKAGARTISVLTLAKTRLGVVN